MGIAPEQRGRTVKKTMVSIYDRDRTPVLIWILALTRLLPDDADPVLDLGF